MSRLSGLSLGGRYPRYPQRRHPWNWIGIKCADSLFDGTPISGGTGSGPQGCAVSFTWLAAHPLSDSHTRPLKATHRTTSTAPARTLGSLPMMDTLAAKEPSILKTTNSVPLGSTVM